MVFPSVTLYNKAITNLYKLFYLLPCFCYDSLWNMVFPSVTLYNKATTNLYKLFNLLPYICYDSL